MSSDFVTVTRTLVKRGWSDIEPKIAIGIATGSIATGLVAFLQPVAKSYGIDVPESVWAGIPLFVSMLGGYITPSVGTTITQPTNDKVTTETHSGPVVTTVTAPTNIVQPGKYDNFLNNLGNHAEVNNAATQILPPPTVLDGAH